jgi:hypothetical protein
MAAGERSEARGRLDPIAEVEALAAFANRAPGSDGERRAARHLAGRLERLGRVAAIESLSTWPRAVGSLALITTLGAAAGPVSLSAPEAGVGLALAALVLLVLETVALFPCARRLLGRRTSQNVVSLSPAERPGALFLVAHLDAGRTGFVHRPGVRRLYARLAHPRRLLGGPLQPLGWLLTAVLACSVARVAGLEGIALTAAQFALTVALIATLLLLVDVWLSPTVPGAGDNASGVALALVLAERLGGALEHFSVNVVLTGAQESGADGMRAYLRRHRGDLPRDRTVVLNLDEVGAGTLRYTRREGPLLALRSHAQLATLAGEIAAEAGPGGPGALDNRAPSDGFATSSAGYAALTVTCRDALGLAPRHHRRSDLPEHVERSALADAEEFCVELIERLDARVGAELG